MDIDTSNPEKWSHPDKIGQDDDCPNCGYSGKGHVTVFSKGKIGRRCLECSATWPIEITDGPPEARPMHHADCPAGDTNCACEILRERDQLRSENTRLKLMAGPSRCEHKTQEEYAVCNRCTQFAMIARSSRKLLQKRQIYLDALLGDRTKLDTAQEEMAQALKQLEELMKLADMSKIWD